MEYKTFQKRAADLGFYPEESSYSSQNFIRKGVGVAHFNGMYSPIGCPICKKWTDELILNQYRTKLIFETSPELALEYLQLLNDTERIDDDPSSSQ